MAFRYWTGKENPEKEKRTRSRTDISNDISLYRAAVNTSKGISLLVWRRAGEQMPRRYVLDPVSRPPFRNPGIGDVVKQREGFSYPANGIQIQRLSAFLQIFIPEVADGTG